MLAPLVNDRGYCTAIEIVEPAADERKTLRRQVHDRRSKIQFALEPRFHGVLVGRGDVGAMVCHQRSHMARGYLLYQPLLDGWYSVW